MAKPPPPRLILKRTTRRVWNGKKYEIVSVTERATADDPVATSPEEATPVEDEEVGFGEWPPKDSEDK